MGTRQIMRLDELSSKVRRSRHTEADSLTTRIIRLAAAFLLDDLQDAFQLTRRTKHMCQAQVHPDDYASQVYTKTPNIYKITVIKIVYCAA